MINLRWKIVILLALALVAFSFVYRAELFGGGEMMGHPTYEIEKYLIAGKYEIFDPSKLALAADKKVILFFSASWCPSCSLFNEEISEVATVLPEDVLILYVDYDENFELRKKYKITYQHTFIIVDTDGNALHRWSGGGVGRLKRELGI